MIANFIQTVMSLTPGFWMVLFNLAAEDAVKVQQRDATYGSSWKKRGGVGAFMMLSRKWDRIENITQKHGYDIFQAVRDFEGDEGIDDGLLADIQDLRRYLLLVEAEVKNTDSSYKCQPNIPKMIKVDEEDINSEQTNDR